MKIGVPNEIHDNECRVAMTPDTAKRLQKLGFETAIEAGAGASAKFNDDAYREAGVEVVSDTTQLWAGSDIILKVRPPEQNTALGKHEIELMPAGSTLISFLWPAQNEDLLKLLEAQNVTAMAMDSVPRISRAQKMDALSSMANIAGYRAVIEAANNFGRFFTGQITAAGKVPPAKVMVIGAGVAGLAAVGTANGLGAIVRAFDTRPEVKQQVESMGAQFLELEFEEETDDGAPSTGYAKVMSKEFIEAEMALFREQAKEVDIIITTALIPGKPAPKLILADMVESMQEGSVVVDLAAEQGGNCELTEPGEVVVKHGVTLIGYMDLPSRLPTQSSQLYGSNLCHMLTDLTPEKDGQINVNMDDDVIRGATVVKDGEISWPPPPISVSAAPAAAPKAEAAAPEPKKKKSGMGLIITMIVAALGLWWLGRVAPAEFMQNFTVFVLSCFIGYMVIWNVTPALHTPLMSVTNAISSVIIIGALLQVGSPSTLIMVLAVISIFITSINIGGGFAVTQRMLQMFRKDD